MKKRVSIILMLFLLVANVCGCTKEEQPLPEQDKNEYEKTEIDEIENFEEVNNNTIIEEMSDEAPYTPYAIETLSERQRELYYELKSKIDDMESFTYTVEDYGEEIVTDLGLAWDALRLDAPQINNYFWLDYEFANSTDATIIAIKSRYFCRWEREDIRDIIKVREGVALFEKTCDAIVENIPENATTYEKYYYLAKVVSEQLQYDYSFDLPGIMCSYSIVTGNAICTGYADIYQYLCMKANLYCHLVWGAIPNGENHMWNLIQLDGETFHVDVTWCDEMGLPGSPEWEQYFVVTQEKILEDHIILDGTEATGTN